MTMNVTYPKKKIIKKKKNLNYAKILISKSEEGKQVQILPVCRKKKISSNCNY